MTALHTPPVIGLHGFAQSGKDTVAGILKGYGYQQLAFADALRDMAYGANPIVSFRTESKTLPGAHGPVTVGDIVPIRYAEVLDRHGYERAKALFPEVRNFLQKLGTEGVRAQSPSYWVDAAIKKIKPGGKYVISDVRFLDEYWGLANHFSGDVMFVKIKRPGFGPVNGHVSDAGLPDDLMDRIIDNDSTLPDLEAQVEARLGLR